MADPSKPVAADKSPRSHYVLTGIPTPGTYKIRLVKGGVHVAALVGYVAKEDRSPIWWVEISGEFKGDGTPNHLTNPWIAKIMEFGEPISHADYLYLLDSAKWAKEFAPNDPMANPNRAVNFNDLDAEF